MTTLNPSLPLSNATLAAPNEAKTELAKITEAAHYLKSRTQAFPQVGIVLGTGLSSLVEEIKVAHTIGYEEIPHFPLSTVESHQGKLIFGELGGKEVVVMQGRFHYYEGYTMQQVVFPVRVMKLLGIEALLVSNAAGGLNAKYHLSDLMLIHDHINLLPDNPLRGQNIEALGVRFPDMSEPYSLDLIQKAKTIAEENHIFLHEGVYASVMGPNLETKAEYRYLRTIGADAVGMSTVPEVVAAAHMGLPVLAISVITDLCSSENLKKITIEEVIQAATQAEPNVTFLFTELIKTL
ncbi:purine-nucleoside phosphorylase [Hugenholtzia roseola]|uniref:purine-nucleoside phosphorylase n=1 Tax=Hugenholtzia roseola TaxID=1002 RepID=UPI000422A75D|nr:purine-nucleoside phosphorylase [Hugenholtzia roseola]